MLPTVGEKAPCLTPYKYPIYNVTNTERCHRLNKCVTNINDCLRFEVFRRVQDICNCTLLIALGIGEEDE